MNTIKLSTIKDNWKDILFWVVTLGAFSIYFWVVFGATSNFPYEDDYDSSIAAVNNYLKADTFSEKLSILSSRHVDHRMLVFRLFLLLNYHLFGQLNFQFLILLGNAFMVIVAYLMFKIFRHTTQLHKLYFVPVILILLNLRYWEIATIEFAIPWYLIIIFSLSALYFLREFSPKKILLFLLFSTLSVWTYANGLLVFLAGLYLIYRLKLDLKFYVICLLCLGINAFLYFKGFLYQNISGRPELSYILTQDLVPLITYYLAMLGNFSIISISYIQINSLIAGIVVLLLVGYMVVKKQYKHQPLVFAIIAFLLLTVAMTSMGRYFIGLWGAFSSRYTLITTVIICVLYISYAEILSSTRLSKTIVLLVSFFYFIGSVYMSYVSIYNFKVEMNRLHVLHNATGDKCFLRYPFGEAGVTHADKILKHAEKTGVYSVPVIAERSSLYSRQTDVAIPRKTSDTNQIAKCNVLRRNGFVYIRANIKSDEFKSGTSCYAVLQADSTKVYECVRAIADYRVSYSVDYFKNLYDTASCFGFLIDTKHFSQPDYAIDIVLSNSMGMCRLPVR